MTETNKNSFYHLCYYVSIALLGASLLSLLLLLPPIQAAIIKIYEFLFSKDNLMDSDHHHFVATRGIYSFSIFLLCSLASYGIYRLKAYKKFDISQKFHFLTIVSFFLLLYGMHQFFIPNFGDDVNPVIVSALDSMWHSEYMLMVIKTWQTRIPGLFTVRLVRLPADFWRLLDSVCMATITEGIIQLSLKKQNRAYAFLICILTLLIPLSVYSSAGWIMTTVTYVWPLACSMPCFVIIKKELNHDKSALYEYATALVLAAIGATELSLIPVFLFASLVFLIYQAFIQERKLSVPSMFIIAVFVLSILELLFALLAPGNRTRSVVELRLFPGYDMLNISDKLKLGMLVSMPYFWGQGFNLNFVIFPLLFILLSKFVKAKQWHLAALQVPGIAIAVVFGILPIMIGKVVSVPSSLLLFKNIQLAQFSHIQNASLAVHLELTIYSLVFIIMVISVFFATGKGYKGMLAALIFIAGFCTQLMIGFSPTVYASCSRTVYYMTIAIFIVTAMVWDTREYEKGSVSFEKELKLIFVFVIVMYLITAITNFVPFDKRRPAQETKPQHCIDSESFESNVLQLQGWAFYGNDDCIVLLETDENV